jgi:proline racemase
MAIMKAINAADPPRHPTRPDIHGCHHVYLAAPGSTAAHSRHAMAIHPGWFDRSPCGTGTSARMAQLHARGALGLHQDFLNESYIGSQFTGRLVDRTTLGEGDAAVEAVVPTITGRAWITGTAQYHLDPTDPFPAGFLL